MRSVRATATCGVRKVHAEQFELRSQPQFPLVNCTPRMIFVKLVVTINVGIKSSPSIPARACYNLYALKWAEGEVP